jgi:hypothetical protein
MIQKTYLEYLDLIYPFKYEIITAILPRYSYSDPKSYALNFLLTRKMGNY